MSLDTVGPSNLYLEEIVVVQRVFLKLTGLLNDGSCSEQERSFVVGIYVPQALVFLDGVFLI